MTLLGGIRLGRARGATKLRGPGVDRCQWVEALGHRVRVRVRKGDGSGTPLVLCNGVGVSLEVFEPFVEALPPGLEVITFDVPGVGGSPLPSVPYTYAGLSILLGRVLDRLGYQNVDILGISWGGGLAQQFAFQNPRRCRRMVLVGSGTGAWMVPARPSVLRLMLTPKRHRDPGYAKAIAAQLYGGALRDNPELVEEIIHRRTRIGPPRGYALQVAALACWSSLPVIRLIRQPTLILAGTDDPLIPLINAKAMRVLLPHARLHTYEDGHLALFTDAANLAPVVADFLDQP
jgi:poly(3-hydroxyalkanoate) depolymerase